MNTLLRLQSVCFCTLLFVLDGYGQTNPPGLQITWAGAPQLALAGPVGSTNRVEYRTSLSPAATWLSLTNLVLTAPTQTLVDHHGASDGMRFYRVVRLDDDEGSARVPAQLQPNQFLTFELNDAGATNQTLLVITGPTSALWVTPGGGATPGGRIVPVAFNFERLDPLVARIEVIFAESDGATTPQTNEFLLVFLDADAGFCEETGNAGMTRFGMFQLDSSRVGQELAPTRLQANEVYVASDTNSTPTALSTLLITGPQSGLLLWSNNMPGGLAAVSLFYSRRSGIHAEVEMVYPAGSIMPEPYTNHYLLLFTSANQGQYEMGGMGATWSYGSFERQTNLMGRAPAPPVLQGGELYTFASQDLDRLVVDTLGINSPNAGILANTNLMDGGIREVVLVYSALGPAAAQVEVTLPAGDAAFEPRTNRYWLLYTDDNHGQYLTSNYMGMVRVGVFDRIPSAGLWLAPAQLQTNELYTFMPQDPVMASPSGLVVGSPQHGWRLQTNVYAMDRGITEMTLRYTALGPLGARLEMITPGDEASPWPSTNRCVLLFLSPNHGYYEATTEAAMRSVASFTRDLSLLGREMTHAELEVYETFVMSRFDGITVFEQWLMAAGPESGALVRVGGWDQGLDQVALSYKRSSPLCCEIDAVVPASLAHPSPTTNQFRFVFTQTAGGVYQETRPDLGNYTGVFQRP